MRPAPIEEPQPTQVALELLQQHLRGRVALAKPLLGWEALVEPLACQLAHEQPRRDDRARVGLRLTRSSSRGVGELP